MILIQKKEIAEMAKMDLLTEIHVLQSRIGFKKNMAVHLMNLK